MVPTLYVEAGGPGGIYCLDGFGGNGFNGGGAGYDDAQGCGGSDFGISGGGGGASDVRTTSCGSSVQFVIDGVNSGNPVALSGSGRSATASLTVSSLSAGSHTITAAYPGDGTFVASTSAALTQKVTYQVQLQYNFVKAVNSGSTVAVKIQLENAAGTNLSASGIPLTVTGLSPSPAPGTAPTGTFTFLTLPDQGPGYQLNVKSTGYPKGTYTLSFTVSGDPTVHTAQFVIG